MKTRLNLFLAASICALAASMASAEGVVSWNVDNNSTVGGEGVGSFPGATNTAGVVDAAYWHNTWPSDPTQNLTNSLGVATTVDLAYSSVNTYTVTGLHPGQDTDGSWNREMLNGYLNSGGGTVSSVTLSDLSATYPSYHLIVYFNSDVAGRMGTVTDGTTTNYFQTLGAASIGADNATLTRAVSTTDEGFTEPANYAVFSNLTGSAQTISCDIADWGGIAAVQLVENTDALFGIIASPMGEVTGDILLEAVMIDGVATFESATLYLDGAQVAVNNITSGTPTNSVSYAVTGLSGGTHTGLVEVVSTTSAGGVAQSHSWTFFVPALVSVTTSPTGALSGDSATLLAVVIEGASSVDTSLTTMTLDGVLVAPLVFDSMAPTTTISYAASGLSVGTHTGKVMVVGTPDGALTNEWTFTVSPPPAITPAVSWNWDAQGTVEGASAVAGIVPVANWNNSWPDFSHSNLLDSAGVATTMAIDWDSFNEFSIQGGHPGGDSDGTYNKELLNGYLNSGASQTPAASTVSLSQIPYSTYDLYVYFSSDVAGRTGQVTDGTTTYYFNTIGPDSIATNTALLAQATATTTAGYGDAANYAVFTGLSGTSQDLAVDIPDFGGIAGFQVVYTGGPTEVPEITSIQVSGTDVTLSWTAGNVGTYRVERKTALTDQTWDTVLGGLPAGNQTTNVTASGADQEFYQISGE